MIWLAFFQLFMWAQELVKFKNKKVMKKVLRTALLTGVFMIGAIAIQA